MSIYLSRIGKALKAFSSVMKGGKYPQDVPNVIFLADSNHRQYLHFSGDGLENGDTISVNASDIKESKTEALNLMVVDSSVVQVRRLYT